MVTLAESIGRRLGLGNGELERLVAGAQLHDVGKVAVPNEILDKAGPLDADEWAIIREHTVIGERILRSVPEMAQVATIVRHSHERWDEADTPTASRATRSRWPAASSSARTPFTRCAPTGVTGRALRRRGHP